MKCNKSSIKMLTMNNYAFYMTDWDDRKSQNSTIISTEHTENSTEKPSNKSKPSNLYFLQKIIIKIKKLFIFKVKLNQKVQPKSNHRGCDLTPNKAA